MYKLKFWMPPITVFVLLALVVIITSIMHYESEKTHTHEKSAQISYFISKNISREIEYRLQALKVVARQIQKEPGQAEFANFAKFLQTEYSGFFAINYVSNNGLIKMVYPEAPNKVALGHNILIERPDLRNYLLESKKTGEPRVTHRILTYQKIFAVVLYVPLFDRKNNFFGWLNGVLYIDNTLVDFMKNSNLDNVSARVSWHHPSETNELKYKWENIDNYQTIDYKIMNQTISIDVALGLTSLERKRDLLYSMTILIRILMLIVISFLVFKLTLSKMKLNEANERLFFKNQMLTSLSHDLATPIMGLLFALKIAANNNEISTKMADTFKNLLKTTEDMLKSIRMLHSYELGVQSIPIEKVPLLNAIKNAISIVDLIAQNKKITFVVSDSITNELSVKANSHTLVNNVLINIFTNSIKFSNIEGKIKIDISIKGNQINLGITDEGPGISEANINKFKRTMSMTSQSVTEGGSGLGLLQVNGFMKQYGGSVTIENVKGGARVTLSFVAG